NLVRATTASPLSGTAMAPPPSPATVVRPPAPVPVPATGARRLAAVQRALSEYGYGQLKPTGAMTAETQAAIQNFERARKLPVTGQVSDRLVGELNAVIGRPIE